MTENEFRPQVVATRAMIWTMLARMDGESTVGGEFWYSVAQQWAIESGISDGTNPASGVTREQLVTMMWRYVGEPEYDYDITGYVDDDKISDWAYAAMEWAVGTGVMTGMGGGVLNPQGEVTRAQLAQFIMNFMVNR